MEVIEKYESGNLKTKTRYFYSDNKSESNIQYIFKYYDTPDERIKCKKIYEKNKDESKTYISYVVYKDINGVIYRPPKNGQDRPSEYNYWENENECSRVYNNEKGQVHRIGLPAWIFHKKNGDLETEQFWQNGWLFNIQGQPIAINYYKNGITSKLFRENYNDKRIFYDKNQKIISRPIDV